MLLQFAGSNYEPLQGTEMSLDYWMDALESGQSVNWPFDKPPVRSRADKSTVAKYH